MLSIRFDADRMREVRSMPYLGTLSIIVQVFFAVHAARTGRYWWIFIILFFPFAGVLIYLFAEYLPDMQGSVSGRKVGAKIQKVVNPGKNIRELEQHLEITDSLKNRENLAEAYFGAGRYQDAVDLLERSLVGAHSNDPHLLEGLCFCYFSMGNFEKAKHCIDRLAEGENGQLPEQVKLLKARTFEELKDYDAAVEEYEKLNNSFQGEEARCRHALLLRQLGRNEEARKLFEAIRTNCRLSTRFYQKSQKRWSDIARAELKSAG
jgi:hypothetical protein